jgi:hypothetical protein
MVKPKESVSVRMKDDGKFPASNRDGNETALPYPAVIRKEDGLELCAKGFIDSGGRCSCDRCLAGKLRSTGAVSRLCPQRNRLRGAGF